MRCPVIPAGLVLLVAAAAPDLGAQAPRRPVSVGLAVGATLPIGDFASDTKTGAHGAAYLQYEPDRNVWAVRGEFAYHRSDYTDEFLGSVNADPDDDLTNGVTYAGAAAVLLGRKKQGGLTPYLLGGFGAYRLTATQTVGSTVQSESANGFGFNAGAGIRLGMNTGFFLEARFHQFSITPDAVAGQTAEKSTYQMIPVTLGFRF
ncbi:MAG: outer membrane beta-barrel protein [Gemmatimonadetes bacterium]|nr:outer membrane beta-barrel protein [Gemmatimonadota bacterium]